MMAGASAELAGELGLPGPELEPTRTLAAVDAWVASDGPLDKDDAARLGFLLARLLIEAHGGGMTVIRAPGHGLDGEWAITGFQRGLAADYHVPFVISAARIGIDRSLSAAKWYAECLREGLQ